MLKITMTKRNNNLLYMLKYRCYRHCTKTHAMQVYSDEEVYM